MMTDESIPTRADVAWRNIDGNDIDVNPTEGVLYPLNSVATRIWLLADGTKRVADMIEILLTEFEGEADTIRQDALLFLAELEKVSLIKKMRKESMVSEQKE